MITKREQLRYAILEVDFLKYTLYAKYPGLWCTIPFCWNAQPSDETSHKTHTKPHITVVKYFLKIANTSEEKNQANTMTNYFSLYPVHEQLITATQT